MMNNNNLPEAILSAEEMRIFEDFDSTTLQGKLVRAFTQAADDETIWIGLKAPYFPAPDVMTQSEMQLHIQIVFSSQPGYSDYNCPIKAMGQVESEVLGASRKIPEPIVAKIRTALQA